MTDALVLTSSAAGGQRLRVALDGLGATALVEPLHGDGAVERLAAAVEAVTRHLPDLLVIGPGVDHVEAVAIAGRIEQRALGARVLLVVEPTPERWRQAANAGVRDLVDPTLDDAAIRTALAPHVAASRAARVRSGADEPVGRLITVVSPKGGSGKTMVATSLAVALARGGGTVALVDLDLQFGDVATGLGLVPEHTMLDVTKSTADLDATTVKVFLTPHDSGLFVLAAPTNPADGERIGVEGVADVLEILRRSFDLVVADTGAGVDEHALAAIERSSDLVAVCALDVASITSLAKELDILDRLGLDAARRHVVLNRVDRGVGLRPDDVERLLGRPVDVRIPANRSVAASANQGVAVVDLLPRSPAARAVRALATRLSGPEEGVRGRRRSRRRSR